MAKWKATNFTGVRSREHATRKHGIRPDQYFSLRYQFEGKRKEEGLGWTSEGWTAEKAALKLAELKTAARTGQGESRLSEKRENRKAELEEKRRAIELENNKPTLIDLWKAYQDSLALKKQKKAASTTLEEHRKWEVIIKPTMGNVRVEDITPAMLSNLLKKVATKAPVNANRLHSLLSVMFKPALEKGWVSVHPLQWVDKPGGSEPARKRFLSDSEIKTLWPCFDMLRPNPRDILKLVLLTAQRPGEVMAMAWADIDMEKAIWTMQKTKNGSIHMVPLSKPVMEILESRNQDTAWVFPSSYNKAKGAESGHAKTQKDARKKLYELSGVAGWTNHDLRRTARTLMSRLKIKHHIRERVLNHNQNGIVGVYDQHDYLQEKNNALEKLAMEIFKIVGNDEKKNNIIKIKVA